MASSQFVFPCPLLPWIMLKPGPQNILPLRFLKLCCLNRLKKHATILTQRLLTRCRLRRRLSGDRQKALFLFSWESAQETVLRCACGVCVVCGIF